jgi:hypothetical protein
MVKLEVDIVLDGYTNSEVDESLARYVTEDLPEGMSATVLDYHGPGGGNPSIELTAPDENTMREALFVYTGQDHREVDFFMGMVEAA